MVDDIPVRRVYKYSEEEMDRAMREADRLLKELAARKNMRDAFASGNVSSSANEEENVEIEYMSCETVTSYDTPHSPCNKVDPLELEQGDLCDTEHRVGEPEAILDYLETPGDIPHTELGGDTSDIDIKEDWQREEHGDDEPEAALETPGDSPDTGVGETSDINIKGEWYREVENTGEDGEDDEVPMENVESSVPSWSSHPTKYKRIHTAGEKMLKCKICGIVFAYSNITTHMKIHTGEKTFECKICERFFSRCHELNAHMKIHTKVKTFNCKICGECFYVFSQLTMHKRIHTGENQFKCKTCEKCFSSSSSLARHKRTHTVKKPYT